MANKGPRRHQKRMSSPPAQNLRVKDYTFSITNKPGAHAKKMSMPLGVLLRDKLAVTTRAKETRMVLNNGSVQVNGIVRYDPRFNVGLFDIVALSEKDQYRLMMDFKGRLVAQAVKTPQTLLAKVKGKKAVKGGRIAISLTNGQTLEEKESKLRVGDSVVMKVGTAKVGEVLPLAVGSSVLLLGGKHVGHVATIENMVDSTWHKPKLLTLKGKNGDFQTTAGNVIVVGNPKPVLKELEGHHE